VLEFIQNYWDWYLGFSVIFGIAGAFNFGSKEEEVNKHVITAIIFGLIWPVVVASRILGDE